MPERTNQRTFSEAMDSYPFRVGNSRLVPLEMHPAVKTAGMALASEAPWEASITAFLLPGMPPHCICVRRWEDNRSWTTAKLFTTVSCSACNAFCYSQINQFLHNQNVSTWSTYAKSNPWNRKACHHLHTRGELSSRMMNNNWELELRLRSMNSSRYKGWTI